MRALVWDGSRLELEDVADPQPSKGNVVVKVETAGVCSTDIQVLNGYMGFTGIPGHEMVGTVIDGPAEWIGKRVVSEINFGCGSCVECTGPGPSHCQARTVMGIDRAAGAFAEKVSAPIANLHEVPGSVTSQEAVFAEPLAAAFEILEQVEVGAGMRCAVLGDGKLGSLCAQVLNQTGAAVTLVGRHERKLEIARLVGVRSEKAEDFSEENLDLVVEATGSPAGLSRAMELTRPRGVVVLKSTVAAEHNLSLAPIVIKELNVVGSRCGPFAVALGHLESGSVTVRPWIDAVYPLEDGAKALAHAAKRGTTKILLDC